MALFLKPAFTLAMGFILMQGMFGAPPENEENPFERATTPTAQYLSFNEDFSSLNSDRFYAWINQSLGVVTNGVLLTKPEAEAEFTSLFHGSDSSNLLEINFHFNYGEFTGANTYQADCWLEMKLHEGSADNWYRLHHQLVFKIINTQWYLTQWEYIPPDVSLSLGYESGMSGSANVPEEYQRFLVDYSSTEMAGTSAWPLLIGTVYTSEAELHPLEAHTPSGGTWKLVDAVATGKPVVLFFFSVQGLSIALPEDFDSQMDFLSSLYDTFGHDDLYIFGVTDDTQDELDWLGESGYTHFAPLLDSGSAMHMALNIDVHPYIVVFDSSGTVVALSKSFHPSSLSLVEDRIREAVAEANALR
jgi:hypothetical protein